MFSFHISRNQLFSFLPFEVINSFSRKIKYRDKILSLMYHEVLSDDDDIDAWTIVKESQFEKQMKYIKRNFDVVSIDEAIEIISKPGTHSGRYAVVTFDDGYRGNHTVAQPIIESLQIPVTVYVATKFIETGELYWYDKLIERIHNLGTTTIDLKEFGFEKYPINHQKTGVGRWKETAKLLEVLKMLSPGQRKEAVKTILDECKAEADVSSSILPLTKGELRKMAVSPYIEIGAHSHCHNILTQLSNHELQETIQKSKDLLEKWTGRSINHFAYPNGNFNPQVEEMVGVLGFRSSQATLSRLWGKEDRLTAIPRIAIGRYDSYGYFKVLTSGVLV